MTKKTDTLRELNEIEDDLRDALFKQVDFLDRKVRRRKALAEIGDAVMHSGASWDTSAKTLVFYASRFTGDQPDRVGDVIDPGAFDNWYARWTRDPLKMYPNTRGKLPIVWSHEWKDLHSCIGWAAPEDVTIDTKGLLIAAHLFDTPEAKRVWEVARDMGWAASFSFDVAKNGEHHERGFNLITEFSRIDEAGPCLLGAEPTAGTREVKAVDAVFAEIKDVARMAARKYGIADPFTAESNAGAAEDGTVSPVVEPHYANQPRCERCRAWQVEVHPPAVPGSVAWGLCTNCGTVMIQAPKSWTTARIKREIALVHSRFDIVPVGTKATEDDRADTLFDLSDKEHTQIAVGIVFAEDGAVKPRWTYRGGTVGSDLSDAERAHVVARVRRAAERYGVDIIREDKARRRRREVLALELDLVKDQARADAVADRKARVLRELADIDAVLAVPKKPERDSVSKSIDNLERVLSSAIGR